MPAKLRLTTMNKQDPLVRLPSGTWIRPKTVRHIAPDRSTPSRPARVVVAYDDNAEGISCDSFELAQQMAEEIAHLINKYN